MIIQNLNKLIVEYVKENEIDIPVEYIPDISHLAYTHNYIQILYSYDNEVLLMLIDLFEKYEIYEECQKIKKTIEDYNKLENKNLKTR